MTSQGESTAMADTSKSERWSFWIDDAVRALRVAGLTLSEAPDGLVDRRAVMVGERDGRVVTCTLRNELAGLPSTEVRCHAEGVPMELTLRPELVGEGFDKLIGMTVDQLVGDAEFDRVFVIASAPRSIAASLLQAAVREKIAALPRSAEGPTLTLREGDISLRWLALPDSDHLTLGVEIVEAVRQLQQQFVEGDGSFGAGPFRQGAAGDRAIDPDARATAWQRFAVARQRTRAVLTAATLAGVGFLAAVILHHP